MPEARAASLVPRADLLKDELFRRNLRQATLGPVCVLGFVALILLGLVFFPHRHPRQGDRLEEEIVQARTAQRFVVSLETGVMAGAFLLTLVAVVWLRRILRRINGAYRESITRAVDQANEFRVLLRSIGDAVVATDAEGRVIFLNPVAETLMGWSSGEAEGRPLEEVFVIFNEQTGAPAENPVGRVLREGTVVGLANHTVLRARDGVERPIDDSAAPILDENGEVRGVILVFHDVSEKHESERRLQKSEARFRNIFEQQFEFMAILSPEGRILEVNELALAAKGLAHGETVGKFFWDAGWWDALPEMRAAWPGRLADAERAGESVVSEDRYETMTGEVRLARASITPVKDARGALEFFIVQASDITEQKRAEEATRENARRLAFLNDLSEKIRAESDPAAIMTLVARLLGRHLHASRCAYADVEPDGEHFTILDDYTDGCPSSAGHYHLSLFGSRAVRKMQEGRTLVIHDVDREIELDEGAAMFSAIGIKAVVSCPLVKEGRFRSAIAVHQNTPRDWTPAEVALVEEVVERSWAYLERVRIETELARTEERLRLAASAAHLGTWDFQPVSGELHWDARCRELMGLPPKGPVRYRTVIGRVHPDDRAEVRQAVLRALRHRGAGPNRGNGQFALECRTLGWDRETPRWVRATGRAFFGDQRELTRFIGTVVDITEDKEAGEALRAAKEQVEAASRAKDNFLAALSHELRTPLTPVLMTAAALREDPRLPEDVREQLVTVERNIALESRLIDDLLDLTRITRGRLLLRPVLCDLHSLIGLAVEIVRDEIQVKSQELTLHLDARRSGLTVDPTRLQQVLWNLLRNAVKFTPERGTIEIRTRDTGEGLRIEISDSGMGLASGELERIFRPFEQAGLENDHRFGGLGLGLAIARAIVELHGGTIRAESPGPGLGATFSVVLPGACEPPEGFTFSAETPSPEEPAPGKGSDQARLLRLLLVEDHEPTIQVLERLLTRAGHTVVSARTVAGGLAAAQQHRFDAVISDLGLPDGTGFELMEKLHAAHGLQGIAVSGYGTDDDMLRSGKAGFLTHLVKPIDFGQLRQALRQFTPGPE